MTANTAAAITSTSRDAYSDASQPDAEQVYQLALRKGAENPAKPKASIIRTGSPDEASTADAFSYGGAIGLVAALTAASGVWVLVDMPGERRPAAWDDGGARAPDRASASEARAREAPARD